MDTPKVQVDKLGIKKVSKEYRKSIERVSKECRRAMSGHSGVSIGYRGCLAGHYFCTSGYRMYGPLAHQAGLGCQGIGGMDLWYTTETWICAMHPHATCPFCCSLGYALFCWCVLRCQKLSFGRLRRLVNSLAQQLRRALAIVAAPSSLASARMDCLPMRPEPRASPPNPHLRPVARLWPYAQRGLGASLLAMQSSITKVSR